MACRWNDGCGCSEISMCGHRVAKAISDRIIRKWSKRQYMEMLILALINWINGGWWLYIVYTVFVSQLCYLYARIYVDDMVNIQLVSLSIALYCNIICMVAVKLEWGNCSESYGCATMHAVFLFAIINLTLHGKESSKNKYSSNLELIITIL